LVQSIFAFIGMVLSAIVMLFSVSKRAQ